MVIVNYFTKWIEAKPLTIITSNNIKKFVWKFIVCRHKYVTKSILALQSITNICVFRFNLPTILIFNNGKQFNNSSFMDFCMSLGIKHKFTLVEHPPNNGQVQLANKIILYELKKRLDKAKGRWAEELPSVLQSYKITPPQTTTQVQM